MKFQIIKELLLVVNKTKMNLLSKKCKPCEGGVMPFDKETAHVYLLDTPLWQMGKGEKKISREFKFKKFTQAIDFVNLVADLAEEEGHHPDIFINFGTVRLELSTHSIKGLSENDFILAVKINDIYSKMNL